jgi:hypothetical protein
MSQRSILRLRLSFCVLLSACLLSSGGVLLWASPKVPLVKKKSNLSGQQTFVGKVKSIDTRGRVLVLTTTEGDQEQSFDYKKNVRVTSAHKVGELRASDLSVGMLVTVYIKSTKSSSEVYEILIM